MNVQCPNKIDMQGKKALHKFLFILELKWNMKSDHAACCQCVPRCSHSKEWRPDPGYYADANNW